MFVQSSVRLFVAVSSWATVARESARRMGPKRCVFTFACQFVLGSSAVVLFRPCFGSQLAKTQTLGGPWSRMASKASSSKGSEDLVGQDLARSLWSQNLAEAEAESKKASDVCFSLKSKTL